MRMRNLPPPERFTLSDKYRIALGVAALVLGLVILARTITVAVSPPAILVSLAFIGFGVYRLWLGYTRLKKLTRASRIE